MEETNVPSTLRSWGGGGLERKMQCGSGCGHDKGRRQAQGADEEQVRDNNAFMSLMLLRDAVSS